MSSASRRPSSLTRRRFLATSTLGSLGTLGAGGLVLGRRPAWAQGTAPAVVTPDSARPQMPSGVMTGDVVADRAIVWSRTDRPARFFVEYSMSESFRDTQRVAGPAALPDSDFTARVDLRGLPAGQEVFCRAFFQDLADPRVMSAPLTCRFRTAPAGRRTVTFAYSGDEAGQGWGINPGWGGMRLYEVMRQRQPDFFIHSGDQIYADGPLKV
jgi:alkaline phosphatase D